MGNSTGSISFQQAIGILVLILDALWFFSCFMSIIILPMQMVIGKLSYKGVPTLIGFVIAEVMMLLIGGGIFLIGIRLLKDQTGLRIPYFNN